MFSAKSFLWAGALWAVATGPVASESLREAVRNALATYPDLASARAEATASVYEMLELERDFLPTVRLYGDAGAERVDDPSSLSVSDNDNTKFRRQLGVEAEFVLFDGYRRANAVYANAARADGSILRLLDASETLALNATEVYIDVYRHLLLQASASRNLEAHRVLGQRVSDLVEGGRLPVSDQLQAMDRIRAAEIALVEVRQAGRDAEARYERIVGHKRNGPLAVPSASPLPRSLAALIDTAQRNSFRIQAATTEVNRTAYQKRIGMADQKPRVSFNYGMSIGEDIGGASGSQKDAYIGLRMDWIISQGGRVARERALIERNSKALSERHMAIRELREMAERTWNSYLSNAETVRITTSQLDTIDQLVDQYDSEFEAGTRTLIDLLDAERSRFSAEFAQISAQASLAFSGYRMLAAQSRLAAHFGVDPRGEALVADLEQRALVKPTAVFNTQIPPLR